MNDTDLELERRLRTHFRDARDEDPTPSELRTAILAIPSADADSGRHCSCTASANCGAAESHARV